MDLKYLHVYERLSGGPVHVEPGMSETLGGGGGLIHERLCLVLPMFCKIHPPPTTPMQVKPTRMLNVENKIGPKT